MSGLGADRPADQSGFYALQDGIEALAARLLLARQAEKSIDAQYYLLKADTAGLAFVDALLRAADRGVRVRLLLDDVFTKGYDAGLAALDSHPNFEVRLFNPFHRGAAGRGWSALTDLARVNRRMHTKSFTVDSQVTILGGRNIAGEYFGAREDARFSDLDVVGIGAIAADVSAMFDSFWNHETALPIGAVVNIPVDPHADLQALRTRIESARREILDTPYAGAVRETTLRFIDEDPETLVWAPYRMVYDSPDKGVRSAEGPAVSIVPALTSALQAAEREAIIVSPYFVPRSSGVQLLNQLEERGVHVTVVTNSLAANNQIAVHGGYAPSRKPLLEGGVELYEVRSDASVPGSEFVAAGGAKSTLHTKAFLVDRRTAFIGSFNFDPRSANLNTESGVIIESESLGSQLGKVFDAGVRNQAYGLFLDHRGRLRWRDDKGSETVVYANEPDSTWWQRFIAGIVRMLPVRGQL